MSGSGSSILRAARPLLALAAFALPLATGCHTTENTSLRVVVVSTDLRPGVDVDRLVAEVTVHKTRTEPLTVTAASGFPTFSVVPASGAGDQVSIKVTAMLGTKVQVTTGARVGFKKGQVSVLTLTLDGRCLGITCTDSDKACNPASVTCVALPKVDVSNLPMYMPPGRDGAADREAPDVPAGGDGFDDGGTDDGGMDGAADAPATPACAAGEHICAGNCVRSDDPKTCGGGCTACSAPQNGTATCDGTSCGGSCPAGKTLCNGACVDGTTCVADCPAGTHACKGLCPSVKDILACGASCATCPVPAGGLQATCDGTKCGFVCMPGYHVCGDTCAADSAAGACGSACTVCPTDPHGSAVCESGGCGIHCATGYHFCMTAGKCLSDTDVGSCGASCTACQPITGGTATCIGGMCGGGCPMGKQLCNGACIDVGLACSNTCPSGSHNCSGVCASNTSTNSCGALCGACPSPTGAASTGCMAGACTITCAGGHHPCGTPVTSCPADDDANACGAACTKCPGDPHGTPLCSGGTCTIQCASGYHKCGAACVSNSALATCGQTECTTACRAPTGGTVSCDGLGCVTSCPTAAPQLCNGACVDRAVACNNMCPANQHVCNGLCQPNTSTSYCGVACQACPVPPAHGQPSCNGSCQIMCDANYRQCAGTSVCVSTAAPACCTSSDCRAPDASMVGTCNANVCSYGCAANYKPCGGQCIPTSQCCSAGDCTAGDTDNTASCSAGHACSYGCRGYTLSSCAASAAGVPVCGSWNFDSSDMAGWSATKPTTGMNGAVGGLTLGNMPGTGSKALKIHLLNNETDIFGVSFKMSLQSLCNGSSTDLRGHKLSFDMYVEGPTVDPLGDNTGMLLVGGFGGACAAITLGVPVSGLKTITTPLFDDLSSSSCATTASPQALDSFSIDVLIDQLGEWNVYLDNVQIL